MNTKGYIPIKVKNKREKLWYLDVSKLGLRELLELRKELLGTSENTMRVLDGLLYNKYNICANNIHYIDKNTNPKKAIKQDIKEEKIKLRRRTKEKRGKKRW